MNYAQTKAQILWVPKNELAAALQELDQARIEEFLRAKDCDWINFNMNVAAASHMGGSWERMIKSVRSVLLVLLQEQGAQLDDEALRTLMTEAENVINSRPLTVDNLSDPASLEPITPNHLLTLKSQVVLPPPGRFVFKEEVASSTAFSQPILDQMASRIPLTPSQETEVKRSSTR